MNNLARTYYITYEGKRTKNSFRSILIKSQDLTELLETLAHAYNIPLFKNYTYKIWQGNWRDCAELSENIYEAAAQIRKFVEQKENEFNEKRGV